MVPSLLGVAEAPEPQWRHVADTVSIATSHLQQRIVLVGHSGAGLLLPVIADALDDEIAALVFVDSILPPPAGHLLLGPPAFMDQLRAMATDDVLAPWSHWFEATVPVPEDWANRRRCAYLLLSATPYGQSAAEARAYCWPVIEIDAVQHLAIATNPLPVTEALLDLERSLQQSTRSSPATK